MLDFYVSSHENYLQEVVYLTIEDTEKNHQFVDSFGEIYQGWGKEGLSIADQKIVVKLPVKMNLVWYSYFEDKFYQINKEWDKNLYSDSNNNFFKHSSSTKDFKFDYLNFGLGINGDVCVWQGDYTNRILLFCDKAKEVEYDWSEFKDKERTDFLAVVEESFPDSPWKDNHYLHTHKALSTELSNVKVVVKGIDVEAYLFKIFNGEVFRKNGGNDSNSIYLNALPTTITLSWHDEQRGTRILKFDFPIMQAVEKLSLQKIVNKDRNIVISFDPSSRVLQCVLIVGDEALILEDISFKIYKG